MGGGRGRRGRSRTAAGRASSAASSARVLDAPRRVSLDLGALDRVLEVDPVSRAARIQARRARARRSRSSSREHGLTLRHFPQSFEFSTLGGWIATRAGGHFATRLDAHRRPRRVRPRDHADGRVGVAAAARLGRGPVARPAAARLARGSLGVDHRGVGARAGRAAARALGAPCASPTFADGAEAVRAIAQSGLHPPTAA